MNTVRRTLATLAVVTLTGCGSTSPSESGTTTPTPTPTATATATPTSTVTSMTSPLTIFYIAVGDAGRSGPLVGCGDSVVATYTAPTDHTDAVGPAINALLSNHHHYLGESGLDNALWQSTLTYRSHTMRGSTILLYLTGTFRLGGVCDIPRVKAQLEYTAMGAAHASRAIVYVGSQTIDQVLSQK